MEMLVEDCVAQMIEVCSKINKEVPEHAKKGLMEMKQLDKLVKKEMESAQKNKVEFMTNYEKMTPDQKTKAFQCLQQQMQKMSEYSEQKIEIAKNLRTLVKNAYSKFREEEQNFIENVKSPVSQRHKTPEGHSENSGPGQRSHRKRKAQEDEDDLASDDKKKGRKKKEVKEEPLNQQEEQEEPKTYCWCQVERQDNMVYCENPLCKYEWFHFGCIGMVTAPVGDWYCTNECRAQALTVKKDEKSPKTLPTSRKLIKKKK